MSKIKINYFETFVSWECNLKCIGCTSYCDYPHHGFPIWKDVREDMISWSQILDVENIGLLGGEPLLNAELYDWIDGTRSIFKDTFILLVTNGLLLDKWPDILKKMIDISPSKIMVTLHLNNEKILNMLEKQIGDCGHRFLVKNHHNQDYFDREYILFDRSKTFSIRVVEPDKFLKRYKGYGQNIYPYNTDNIEEAHKQCIDRPLLYNGRLYRCSKIALLKRQLKMTGQLYNEEECRLWQQYLNYKGIGYDQSIEEISDYLIKFNKAEMVCRSCPGKIQECMIKNEQNNKPVEFMIGNKE